MFKSTDDGATWGIANAGLSDIGVSAGAIDPTTSGAVYAVADGRVFKSSDAAVTWEMTGPDSYDGSLVIGG